MEKIMDTNEVVDRAVQNGLCGQSCSEAIAGAFAEWLGLNDPFGDWACGFAGGMGLRGETCGVVAAAMLVIGVEFGEYEADIQKKRALILSLSSEFAEVFAQENGSTTCEILCHGADLRSSEGAKALRESGRPEQLIRSGSLLLSRMIVRERAKRE